MKSASLQYRPDIDGLRAIAVLAVIFYHFKIPPFTGGFIGVDIFFVISGYLITKLVMGQTGAGTFSFKAFYMRRVRRLFPALFVTLCGSLLAGLFLFSAEQMARLGKISIAALLSLSNIVFWREAGYFDTDAVTKPLLHTWSLGVEEQFYLVWPALIFGLCLSLKRTKIIAVLLALLILGIVGAEFMLSRNVDAAFYLTPFRLSEFAVGAILVWLEKFRPVKSGMVEPIFVLGLALMIVPIIFYTDQIRFPGVNAFIPCLGAALLIFVAPASKLKGLLANRAMVGIGLISYSLYLFHWPLYVFTKQALGDISLTLAAGLVCISIGLATLSYYVVETPFRRTRTKPKTYAPIGYIAAALFVMSISASAVHTHGFQGRFDAGVSSLVNYKEDFKTTNRMGTCYLKKNGDWHNIPTWCYDKSRLQFANERTYLLLGSSHAADLWPGFAQVFKDENVLQLNMAGCLVRNHPMAKADAGCNAFNRFVFDDVLKNNFYDLVIFSAGEIPTVGWKDTAAVFTERGQDYVVFGMRPKLTDIPHDLASKHGKLDGISELLTANMRAASDTQWRAVLPDDKFFSVQTAICPTNDSCTWIVDGHLSYRDKSHFNTEGSVVVAEAFQAWLVKNRP